jgi:hypothetical protein
MKKVFWILIIVSGFLVPLIFMIIVPIVLFKMSWWWFFGTLIFEFIVGIVVGLVYLIILLRKKPEMNIKMDISGAIAKAKHERVYDEDDPDNFIITKIVPTNSGEKGSESNILWLRGYGSETNKNWDCIINLDVPKKGFAWIPDAKEEDDIRVKETIRSIAEHPAYEEKVETRTGRNAFGEVETTTTAKRMTQTEKKELEEKKKEEAVKDM